jgi:hypothetical protein
MCSSTKVSRIESGSRAVNPRDVRDLSRLYELDEEETRQLLELTRESRQSSWWQDFSVNYGTFIGLEQSASTICEYNPLIIPALLQVEDYARALIGDLARKLPPDVIESRVQARMKRQEILLQNDAPDLFAIVDELALLRPVGTEAIMQAQVAHLIEASTASNVHLQVIPLATGAYTGYSHAFTLLEFATPDVGSVVYIEGYLGDLYLERSEDVAKYRALFNDLRSAGRGPRESRDHLQRIRSSN